MRFHERDRLLFSIPFISKEQATSPENRKNDTPIQIYIITKGALLVDDGIGDEFAVASDN